MDDPTPKIAPEKKTTFKVFKENFITNAGFLANFLELAVDFLGALCHFGCLLWRFSVCYFRSKGPL